MPTRVRFRLNKLSGEIEEFIVDDQDRNLPEAEHDRIATEVAQVIARRPIVTPVGSAAGQPEVDVQINTGDRETESDRPDTEQETQVRRQ